MISALFFYVCNIVYIGALYDFSQYGLKDFRIHRAVFAGLLFSGRATVYLLWNWIKPPYISILLNYVLFTVLVLLAFHGSRAKKILTAAILITVRVLAGNFLGAFFPILYLIGRNLAVGGQNIATSPVVENVMEGFIFLILSITIVILRKRIVPVLENKVDSWYLMLSLPLFFIVLIVEAVNWGGSNGIVVVSDGTGAQYWNLYYNEIFSLIAICLLTALSMCLSGGLVFGMDKIYREQQKAAQYHSQITIYKMLNEQYSQMERLRHDFKNHVLSLYGLWKGSEWEKMGNYLEKMIEGGNIGRDDEVTGNQAIDALLYYKRKQAGQDGILWECDVQIPKDCRIDVFDLSVLFGNSLDNALSSCRECEESLRFVNIRTQWMNHCFLMVVRNGTNMEDIGEMRKGTGFLNLEETVKKYHGTIEVRVEKHVFELSVLMVMPFL